MGLGVSPTTACGLCSIFSVSLFFLSLKEQVHSRCLQQDMMPMRQVTGVLASSKDRLQQDITSFT